MEWIGGTQSPIARGYLRAAVIRRRHPDVDLRFDVHDIDAAGFDRGGSSSVQLSRPAHERWQPVKFEHGFSGQLLKDVFVGTTPSGPALTIAGLSTSLDGFASALRSAVAQSIARAVSIASAAPLLWKADAVRQRGEELVAVAASVLEGGATWSSFCIEVSRFLLGVRLDRVTLETTGAYWSEASFRTHPERFCVLARFLEDERLRIVFAEQFHKRGLDVPYFVMFSRHGETLRLPLRLHSDRRLTLDQILLGTIDELGDPARLFTRLHEAGCFDCVLVPKAVPLFAQLRSDGVLFGKVPEYASAGERCIALLGLEVNPMAVIRFDLAKALGRRHWRACLSFIRTTKLSAKVDHHWLTTPVLPELWLLGGTAIVDAIVETATVTLKGGKRANAYAGDSIAC
jgi:hypothetical protein